MVGVVQRNDTVNSTPTLYPCAAIFLPKILFVQNSAWLQGDSMDCEAGVATGELRYVCERSLSMTATCTRFGMPMTSTYLTNILNCQSARQQNYLFWTGHTSSLVGHFFETFIMQGGWNFWKPMEKGKITCRLRCFLSRPETQVLCSLLQMSPQL